MVGCSVGTAWWDVVWGQHGHGGGAESVIRHMGWR
jgi:hypothetical protein